MLQSCLTRACLCLLTNNSIGMKKQAFSIPRGFIFFYSYKMIKMIQQIDIDKIPPNLNEVLNMAKRHWGAYYGQKKTWGKLISDYCELSNMQPMDTPIDITIQNTYPCKRRRDPDNIILKFILDGIVEAGIIPDDTFEHINSIRILKPKIEKKVKRTLITLETVNKTKQE